jgi:hypothetical protein
MREIFEKAGIDAARIKILEQRILRSYVGILRAPLDFDGNRTRTLARHGAYDVRLVEPSEPSADDAASFWIELFDHGQKSALDSFGSDDIEEAARRAAALIAEAEMLDRHPAQRLLRSYRCH